MVGQYLEYFAYIAALSNPTPMGRSFVVARVGLNNLPASTAFFSSVDVDTVLRKEPGKKTLANVVVYFEISQFQIPLVKYGVRSPKFIWAAYHLMYTAVLIG
jgi:hypothetical protein